MEILSQTLQNAFHFVTETHCGPSEVHLFIIWRQAHGLMFIQVL